jgi:general secretion pathway protein I
VSALRRRRQRCAGFTLVEVLVAVAVVAVALGAGMRAAGALTDNAQRLASVTAAQWCADNHLTGLKLARAFPGVGESEFECDQLGIAYRGKLTVVATPNPAFRRINAQVSDEAGTPIYSLSTILGRFR